MYQRGFHRCEEHFNYQRILKDPFSLRVYQTGSEEHLTTERKDLNVQTSFEETLVF